MAIRPWILYCSQDACLNPGKTVEMSQKGLMSKNILKKLWTHILQSDPIQNRKNVDVCRASLMKLLGQIGYATQFINQIIPVTALG